MPTFLDRAERAGGRPQTQAAKADQESGSEFQYPARKEDWLDACLAPNPYKEEREDE